MTDQNRWAVRKDPVLLRHELTLDGNPVAVYGSAEYLEKVAERLNRRHIPDLPPAPEPGDPSCRCGPCPILDHQGKANGEG